MKYVQDVDPSCRRVDFVNEDVAIGMIPSFGGDVFEPRKILDWTALVVARRQRLYLGSQVGIPDVSLADASMFRVVSQITRSSRWAGKLMTTANLGVR
jgi:hypothetical protein